MQVTDEMREGALAVKHKILELIKKELGDNPSPDRKATVGAGVEFALHEFLAITFDNDYKVLEASLAIAERLPEGALLKFLENKQRVQ